MGKIFNIDYYKLIRLLLPQLLRNPVIISFLEAAASPVDRLYGVFLRNRNANMYHLGVTPQVCYLEKALNDRFDSSDRRIYITAGGHYARMYIYTRPEGRPVYLRTRAEDRPVHLPTHRESGPGSYYFVVNVPASLRYNRQEMEVFVSAYKLAGTSFVISEQLSVNSYQ